MPVYEYRCEACGEHHEVLQKMSDEPLVVCPACGEEALRKLISPTAFVLKGSGWYRDHYGLKSSGGDGKGSAGSKGASAGAGEAAASSSSKSSGGDSGRGS